MLRRARYLAGVAACAPRAVAPGSCVWAHLAVAGASSRRCESSTSGSVAVSSSSSSVRPPSPLRAPQPPPPAPPASLARRAEELARYLPLAKWNLPASLRPTRVDGVWQRPKVTSLVRARIRRAALLAMAAGDTENVWNYDWDRPLAAGVQRPPRSTIGRDAKVAERCVRLGAVWPAAVCC